MPRWLVLSLVVWCAPALAQDDTPDAASIPDASVGQGGAGRASPEEEDSRKSCLTDSDCENGFRCEGGRCAYQRYRDATFEGCGCGAGSGGLAAALALGLTWRSARSSSARRRRAGPG